jgi:hypothetical protein
MCKVGGDPHAIVDELTAEAQRLGLGYDPRRVDLSGDDSEK